MISILKYFKKKEWFYISLSVIFIFIQVWLNLKIPDYMKEITMFVQTPGSKMSEILTAGGMMLLCTLGSVLAAVTVGYIAARVAASFSRRLRDRVFSKVVGFSSEEVNQFSTSSLMTRTTNDITQVQVIIALGLQLLIYAPIMSIWAIAKISTKSWQWPLATGIALFILITVVTIIFILVLPKFKKVQGLTDKINKVSRENITGIKVVHAYNASDYQEEKFEEVNVELASTNLYTQKVMAFLNPTMSLIMNGLTLAIYWIGTYIIISASPVNRVDVFGDMVIFSHYTIQIIQAFMMLTMVFIYLPRASVSAKRINEVLNSESKLIEGKYRDDTITLGAIEFKNVSFKYPNASEYILEDISFSVNKGETVAFIGSTGSGKSTLINLIPRFFDVTEGAIFVDGIEVSEYDFKTLNNKIGYISQKPVLFSGSIFSNIAYGESQKEITEEEVTNALDTAQGLDFVMATDAKLDLQVSQRGTNLSGGQKQRIAIARALAKKPEILIFDDSFSALDYKTDKLLRHRLKTDIKDTTKLIVAQRIGTIIDADKIIVLDNGRIVGSGTHDELMTNCQVYQEIAYSQLSMEELNYEQAR